MIVKILILDTFFPDFLSFWSIFDKKKNGKKWGDIKFDEDEDEDEDVNGDDDDGYLVMIFDLKHCVTYLCPTYYTHLPMAPIL